MQTSADHRDYMEAPVNVDFIVLISAASRARAVGTSLISTKLDHHLLYLYVAKSAPASEL